MKRVRMAMLGASRIHVRPTKQLLLHLSFEGGGQSGVITEVREWLMERLGNHGKSLRGVEDTR
jgi:hypothetical protein